MKSTGSNVVVLLTATIDPRTTAMVARRNPKERMDDYKHALRICWLAERRIQKLVLCENSNFDLAEVRELCDARARQDLVVDLISFEGQRFPAHLGKGYGELGIIDHALQHSVFLKDDRQVVVKATGRLLVRNVGAIIGWAERHSGFDIACDLRGNLQWADSRVFAARVGFLRDYLLPLQRFADDSQGVTFEHVLSRATHRVLADGGRWVPLGCTPALRGISGTSGEPYPSSHIGWLRRDLFRRVKNWALAR